MFKLYAMNAIGTEILISEAVKKDDMASAMKLVAETGMSPVAKRISRTQSEIIKGVFASYK